jgi:ubiquitin fusion degradation protein 1
MMANLLVNEGQDVQLRLIHLPSVTFVKFQPASIKFSETITTPKESLELALMNFTTLTLHDSVLIKCSGQDFYMNVVELKPADAVCVVNAQVQYTWSSHYMFLNHTNRYDEQYIINFISV